MFQETDHQQHTLRLVASSITQHRLTLTQVPLFTKTEDGWLTQGYHQANIKRYWQKISNFFFQKSPFSHSQPQITENQASILETGLGTLSPVSTMHNPVS